MKKTELKSEIVFSWHVIKKELEKITSLARDKIAEDLNLIDVKYFCFLLDC